MRTLISDEKGVRNMKGNRIIMIFAALCIMLIAVMALPVTVHAEGTSARAAVVIDPSTGAVLYEQNSRGRLPMASTTKIMSALIALESGRLDEEFTVDSEAIKVEGSSMGLQEGDRVTMRALVCGMLLPSGNDAANAAAVRVAGSTERFVGMMNRRAAEMGLSDTHFVTPSGLDDDTDEHYSSALDMARLAAECMKNRDFAEICSQQYIKVRFGAPPYDRTLRNTNKLLGTLDGCRGIKTGFTDKAGRCLISACERDGAQLICVTLNDRSDWDDHTALYEQCFAKMHTYRLPDSGREYKIKIAGGRKSTVEAAAPPLIMSLPSDAAGRLTHKVCIARFIPAPVESGDKLGEVKYYFDGRPIGSVSIFAVESVTPVIKRESDWQQLLRYLDEGLGKREAL